jgi:hypothetical protein
MKETYCSLAWNHHFIGPGGRTKPCCRFKGQNVPKTHHLNHNDLETLFNDDFMNEIRDKMIKGKRVPGCEKCYEEEDNSKRASLREIHNRMESITKGIDLDKPLITFMESAFSNICDVQCVMCGPFFSTSWSNQDLTELEGLIEPFGKLSIDIDSIKSVIPNLIYLKFTGGEPLLINDYYTILEERLKYPGIEKCFLNYSTNLMRFPKQRLLDIWKKVDFVEVATSFDGVGKTIEYVRYPTKWEIVEENLIKYFQLSNDMDVRVGMRSTILPYNILNIIDMYHWWIKNVNKYYVSPFGEYSWVNPTHVAQPKHITLKVLPQTCKNMISNKLKDKFTINKVQQSIDHLCNYMNSEDHTMYLDDFKRFTKVMDKRGITLEEIEPELYNEIF